MSDAILRVALAGSVDDGKSTLLGRLVHDLGAYYKDELEHIIEASERRGFARTELGLLTDGLRAEREQGITIDVAHRTLITPKRRLLLADTPGHVEYTRNMITACTAADAAIILFDARRGLTEQSRRHLTIATLLGVGTLIVAVNKMDRVGYDAARFAELSAEAERIVGCASRLPGVGSAPRLHTIPVSALQGDNVIEPSVNTPYYQGPTLLGLLEEAPCSFRQPEQPLRLPVQRVLRPQTDEHEDYRGYAGRVAQGTVAVGDALRVLRSGRSARVERIESAQGDRERAGAGKSVVVHLAADVDVARGDVLTREGEAQPRSTRQARVTLLKLAESGIREGARIAIKHGARTVKGTISALGDALDLDRLEFAPAAADIDPNAVLLADLSFDEPLDVDAYAVSRGFGAVVLSEATSGHTLGAGLLHAP